MKMTGLGYPRSTGLGLGMAFAAALGCSGRDRTEVALHERGDVAGGGVELSSVRLALESDSLEAGSERGVEWEDCADGFQCATLRVPLDYDSARGERLSVAITRLPARDATRRVGPLFVNFGGPGDPAVETLHFIGQAPLARLNEQFDIVAFDPRGTGRTEGALDCRINQETEGLYALPFTTPLNFDFDAWHARAQHYVDACVAANGEQSFAHVSTADVARDMDSVRAALGDSQLSYLGFSYGTFLGATYAALFPHNYRALVLDGALDADQYINHPTAWLRSQTAGFERALGRFFQACAANREACFGFGGADPLRAFDRMVAAANVSPLVVPGSDRTLSGDGILNGALTMLYLKQSWSFLAESLAAAEAGDPTLLQLVVDSSFGRLEDGSFEPTTDRYFILTAAEHGYGADPSDYVAAGYESWSEFDHFFVNTGYSELPYALFREYQTADAYHGPFVADRRAPPILVIGTTYDPATPYRGAELLVETLGNAQLLTMVGDGHTAYGRNSSCIDAAVETYFLDGILPDAGAECAQEVPFEPPPDPSADAASKSAETGSAMFVGRRTPRRAPIAMLGGPAARAMGAELQRRARLGSNPRTKTEAR